LELAQIRYFVTLCSERNFTRAARRCGVSQPSLSNGIKALECELGGKLFERSDMSLTPLGKRLRLHFESAVASVGQITKRAMAFHRRQLAMRRIVEARNQPLLDPAGSLSRAKSLEEAKQREAAHDRDSREDDGGQHIVAYQDRAAQQRENHRLR
jgi:DNA-binding transcriptional LysR family regulator